MKKFKYLLRDTKGKIREVVESDKALSFGNVRQMTPEEYEKFSRGKIIKAAPPVVVDWYEQEVLQ